MINTLLYRLAIGAYATGIKLYTPFNPKARLFVDGRKGLNRKIYNALSIEKKPRIWVHCASLGEFEQGRPLIETIKAQYPQYAIVLTFFSPSGYEVRKDYDGADYVFYLPVDAPGNADAFLDAVNPKLCLFVKYELWYYYLSALQKRGIKSLLVSAVFTERHGFFKWYGDLQRKMLQCFTHIFVQDAQSKTLLESINISNVSVSGDTRFDRVVKAAGEARAIPIAEAFCKGYDILVAGSTWADDEEMLKQVLDQLPDNWKLVLVPHNIDATHIDKIETLFAGNIVKWGDYKSEAPGRVLLVNKVGLLMQLYRYAKAAYIGGGFGKEGVHNVLEAAVYGKPCLYGPIYHQFIEAGELVAAGGAIVVHNAGDTAAALNKLTDTDTCQQLGQAARNYVLGKQGATAIIMKAIAQELGSR